MRLYKYIWFFISSLMLCPLPAMDNPFSYESGINDCDVIKYNGEYYITGNWLGGDMFQSRNLSDWGQRTHIFSPDNTWHVPRNSNPDMDIHGTHIAYDNGLFHLYAHLDSNALLGIVHAVSTSVTGPYYEPLDSPFDTSTIDVKTFRDEDGSLHYYSTRFGGVSGNHNDYRSMTDYYTKAASGKTLIWPVDGWEINPEREQFSPPNPVPTINEGPFVFKYHNNYYMMYNANHTGDTSYALGAAMASAPDSFNNAGKNPDPVLAKTQYTKNDNTYEIYTLGQPWVIEGLNGFERWAGYFAIDSSERGYGRTQRIDRVLFLDNKLYVDGPTNRYTPGYHPAPAEPQLRALFYQPDGPLPDTDWQEVSPNNNFGLWNVKNNEACQDSQQCFSFNLANRAPATNYLFEANLKMPEVSDGEDKAGIVAYYIDSDHWMIIGLDRSQNYGADNWYCHLVTDDYNGVIAAGGFAGELDYSVYHKIRLERNGKVFRLWIDDMLPPGGGIINTELTDPAIPGLYSDHAAAAYDGVIYTVGWDEFSDRINGWGSSLAGSEKVGSWTVNSTGLISNSSTGKVYKGDLMDTYEFSLDLYKNSTANGKMGVYAAARDNRNYLKAGFNLDNNTFYVYGMNQSVILPQRSVPVEDKDNYNLRVVKLTDKFIFFVDGKELITSHYSYDSSQVGLFNESMSARFDNITVFQTNLDNLPDQWKTADVGDTGFPGTSQYNDGTFTINGSGNDIWLTDDGFHFTYQQLYGDGEIVARLVSNDITNWWNKAALMIRDGLNANAAMAMVTLCGGGNLQFIWRNSAGVNAQVLAPSGSPYPQMIWLKLKKIGIRYYAYYSYDNLTWTSIGNATPGLDSKYLNIGLAACSHDNNMLNGVVFDNVAITGCTPGEFAADICPDCIIDLADLSVLADSWLEDASFNINDTTFIDLLDYSQIAINWLETYDR